ncbi:peptidoglycan DD-metalloendopeptidase family protein [Paenibacillus marinisediminis]
MYKQGTTTWRWVWMRGPNQPAVQFSISPRIAISAIILLVCLIISLITGLIMYVQHNRELTEINAALQSQIEQQQTAIAALEADLTVLNQESALMQSQMDKVSKLEQQLQQYIQLSADSVAAKLALPTEVQSTESSEKPRLHSLRINPTTLSQEQDSVGGEFVSPPAPTGSQAPHSSTDDMLQQLDHMMTTILRWDKDIPELLIQAEVIKKELNAIPTLWPTTATRITSTFGTRDDPFNRREAFHNGLDIGGSIGESVLAAADGTVIEAGYDYARGNYIIIRHTANITTRYLHLSEILVENDQAVKMGTQIGKLGNSGRSTGPHLHFEIHKLDMPLDPLSMLVSP